jgi:class 3 adenylate cyclase
MQPGPVATPAPRASLTRATVLFADLVGFGALSERMGPEPAYLVVTRAVRLLDSVVRRYGGSVDKYLGDCLMAVFGYPVPLARAALAAAEATATSSSSQCRSRS